MPTHANRLPAVRFAAAAAFRPSIAAGALLVALAAPLSAQSRLTALVGPPALGTTCFVQHRLPVGATSLVGGFLWSAPFAGAVAVPGLAVSGLLRVDPASFVVLGTGVPTVAQPLAMPVAVPNQTALLGAQLECQSFDLPASGTFELAANDVLLTVVSGPSASLDMAPVPPGTFLMGSSAPIGAAPYFNDLSSQPVRAVTISRPFWMGRHEVTQAQYQAVMGANPSLFQGAGLPNAPQRPVESVSWNNAVTYCQALTAIEQAAGRVPAGYQYRLPTEAEWEYCCRAGATTEFHTGTALVCGQANFLFSDHSNTSCSIGQTAVVGSYAPNAFGLHDMHGNVSEWCLDGSAAYSAGAVTDPYVSGDPEEPFVYRGGNWSAYSRSCRSAARGGDLATNSYFLVGFRVVLGPVLP
jgi:formylglycine-generating enzyme required for sulfatase activity